MDQIRPLYVTPDFIGPCGEAEGGGQIGPMYVSPETS